MEKHAQKALSIAPAEPSPEVLALLAQAVQHASLADIREQIDSGAAKLFAVTDEGVLCMAFVLRVDVLAAGSEGVIVAAAGDCEGVNLTETMMPVIEKMFVNCISVRVHTARPGLIRQLTRRHGYQPQEMVLTKALCHG